jgi:hypothetical protein
MLVNHTSINIFGKFIATLPQDFIPLVGDLSADPKGGEVSWIAKNLTLDSS